jgi:hypothetical protein
VKSLFFNYFHHIYILSFINKFNYKISEVLIFKIYKIFLMNLKIKIEVNVLKYFHQNINILYIKL